MNECPAPVPGRRTAEVLRLSTYLLAFAIFFTIVWTGKYFGHPSLEQVSYHLNFGSEGLLNSDPKMLVRFIKWVVLPTLLMTALAAYLERRQRVRGPMPARRGLVRLKKTFPLLLLAFSTMWLLHRVSALEFITASYGADYFSPNYLRPENVEVKAGKPKNLVLVYVESLEAGYGDPALFGRDLLAPLKELGGVSFPSFPGAPGTGWTIAGIVASQCGLPLKSVTVYNINDQGQSMKSYLPNARCLPDVLDSLGYRNVFMGGASLDFAGKGLFLRNHHYHELYGKEEWIADGVDPESLADWWGLHDDDLLARARRKLVALHEAGQPFNLTLLTVDTHPPRGYLSKACAAHNSGGKFESIVACTARQVADLVRFIEERGWMEDTRVVVVGDHVSMPNPVSDKLETIPERSIFNAFYPARAMNRQRDEILHFDLFPTILDFIGVEVPGGRLGLGYSGMNAGARPPQERLAEMRKALLNKSDTYLELWNLAQAGRASQ